MNHAEATDTVTTNGYTVALMKTGTAGKLLMITPAEVRTLYLRFLKVSRL